MKRAVLSLVLAAATLATPVLADEERGVEAYQRGSQLLKGGKPAEALVVLEASMRELPSPNTELLIAHALRDLGRKAEAEERYVAVVREASARLARGEDRYGPTLADAKRWTAALRPSLAELAIVIERAPAGTVITVDGADARTEVGASAVRAHVWHLPGHAEIAIKAPSGAIEHASAELTAGGASEVRLVFVRDASGESLREAVVAPAPRSLRPPAVSLVLGSVAVVALGTFIGFGADANGAADELDACRRSTTGCPAAKYQPVADRGSRSAAVANVSVAIAGAGLAAATVIWIVSARRREPRSGLEQVPLTVRF